MMQYVFVLVIKLNLDGSLIECLVKQLKIDDVVLVKFGEIVFIDGVVIDGNVVVDELMFIGEFNFVCKLNSSLVYGGMVC